MYVSTTWWTKTPKNICFHSTTEQLFINKWEKWHFYSAREKWSILLCCKITLLTRVVHYMFPEFFLIYVIIKTNVNNFGLVHNKHSFNNKVMPWDIVAKTTVWTWTSALSTSKLGETKSHSFYDPKCFEFDITYTQIVLYVVYW